MADANAFAGIRVVDLTTPTSGFGEYLHHATGSRGANELGAGTACLVNMPIHRRYRGGKPRSYWPFGVQTDLQTAQTWTTAFQAAVAGGLETYLAALEGLTVGTTVLGVLVSISYYAGFTIRPSPPIAGVRARNVSTPRSVAITPDPILAINPSIKVSSQRRRNLQRV
jgi:hypothetical protein